MASNKLATALPEDERKSDSFLVRCTVADGRRILEQARIRSLSRSEFVRRAALGRTANVDYETGTILALSALTRAIRDLHAALAEYRLPLMEEQLQPIMDGITATMHRMGK